jgi:enamine deaminase RidA (YjgF/YER057c/UK114 family)
MTERRAILSGSTFEEQIGYARAVVDGDWVHVSGTTGFDYATMTISDDVVEQRRCRDGPLAGSPWPKVS